MVPLVPCRHHQLPGAPLHIAPSRQPSLGSDHFASPKSAQLVQLVVDVVELVWAVRVVSLSSVQMLLSLWFQATAGPLVAVPIVALVPLVPWRVASMAWRVLEESTASAWLALAAWLATLALASQLALLAMLVMATRLRS